MKTPSIGVVFITHRAKQHLPHCLPPILSSPLKPKILVMNSSSHDGTVPLAEEYGALTCTIPRGEFNHGTTREKARQLLKTEIVVMMTPDAYAQDSAMLTHLTKPLIEKTASISYARQIPHQNAGFFASFPREFNYPTESHIRSFEDRMKWGVYTIFCSDSCAAYRSQALDEIGGFTPCLIGEDTFTTAKLLKNGHKIAYVAEAIVHHSHEYSLWQEFTRHFDTGLAREWNRELLEDFQRDETRGYAYVKTMIQKLWQKAPQSIPYAFLQIAIKYLGYRIGKGSRKAPIWIKKRLSGQDFYWRNAQENSSFNL